MERYFTKIKLFSVGLLSLLTSIQLMAQDLGPSAYSKLTWDHISTFRSDSYDVGNTIGLTTDKKIYVWGDNKVFTIHTNNGTSSGTTEVYPLQQTAPFYVPSPAGETIKKVQTKLTSSSQERAPTFFCLSESGKLYAWGFNNGLLATAWPVPAGAPSKALSDTTRHRRTPIQLTILGESTFVDFDASTYGNYWVAIGTSGKAYHNGNNGSGPSYIYGTIPNPVGVDNATFKYIKAWVYKENLNIPFIYLKGNDGKIYFTGSFQSLFNSGIPSLYKRNVPAPTITTDEASGNVRVMSPREVPFPAGEDIVKMEIGMPNAEENQTTFALSASGKGYVAGLWRVMHPTINIYTTRYVVVPLKTAPLSADVEVRFRGSTDTTHILKRFVEIAVPPGASKILDITSHDRGSGYGAGHGCSVVGDNNKVYWSGSLAGVSDIRVYASNYLSLSNNNFSNSYDECIGMRSSSTLSQYVWSQESINFEGASQLFTTGNTNSGGETQIGIISKTGRGYFAGVLEANTGTGKVHGDGGGAAGFQFSAYPVPIANEQLLSCQTSPGTGGPWTSGPVTPTNTAVGTIDCSKTKLYPAPVAGVPSQLSLIVTVNVTTIGDFTPITVSGSGMSLPSGFSSVSATTTGVQQFHIPLNYDGTALTNAFQFTVGSAGSCSADLTQKSNPVITNVWNLTNCSAIAPGVLSK